MGFTCSSDDPKIGANGAAKEAYKDLFYKTGVDTCIRQSINTQYDTSIYTWFHLFSADTL